jgi:hypothetical protein
MCLKRKTERKEKTDEHRRGKTKPKKKIGERSETKKSTGNILRFISPTCKMEDFP